MSVFGFSTEASAGGDFLPIVKYDARAGRMFRVDRVQDGGTWVKSEEDITNSFKAQFDLENVETGWANFPAGAAPSFVLVPMGSAIPPRPADGFKNCVRILVKLHADCGGGVREVASSAKAFLSGLEALYLAYLDGVKANAGKLPIITLKTTKPIKSEGGGKVSTNYQPVFEIVGWAPRGDFAFVPKAGGNYAPAGAPVPHATAPSMGVPPSTGSTLAAPPSAKPMPESLESGFG